MDSPALPIGTRAPRGGSIVYNLDSVQGHVKVLNDYVDTDLLPTASKRRPKPHSSVTLTEDTESLLHTRENIQNENHEQRLISSKNTQSRPSHNTVIEQPVAVSQLPIDPIKKTGIENSIICKVCGKCKCKQCTDKRDLPAVGACCGLKSETTVNDIVECITCLKCVKGGYYHCCYSEDELSASENPCACCAQPNCAPRWACLGLASILMPCLCCYWPLRGCVRALTSCYNTCCVERGCKCSEKKITTFMFSTDLSSESTSSTFV